MTVAVLTAIPQELGHLRAALEDGAEVTAGPLTAYRGRIDGVPVLVAGAGIGKVNTALAATLLLDRLGASAMIFSGVAGGLDPALAIGDVVVADHLGQHDAGWIEHGRLTPYHPGHIPFFNPVDAFGYSLDPELKARAEAALAGLVLPPVSRAAGGEDRPPRVVFGRVLTGDSYIHCEDTRTRLAGEIGGQAVEMEGAAMAQVCDAFGAPWLVVRALSDLAGRDSRIDFHAFVTDVAAISAVIVRRLLPVI